MAHESKAMTSISLKEYFARDGGALSHKDAAVIGPVLEALAEQRGVTARDVLDAARSINSPLHSYFEWSDKVAADLHRLDQARVILRTIRVRYVEPTGEQRVVRAFQVQRSVGFDTSPRTYRTFQVLHGDSAFAAQMMDSAFDDLQNWKRKYEPYIGMWTNFGDVFQQVINQISEWSDEFASQNVTAETDEALVKLLAWKEECQNALTTWTGAREQMEFIMGAIGHAETIFAKVSEFKERDCMKCRRPFMSVSSGNRICKTCLNAKTINEKNQGVINAEIVG